MSIYNFLQQHFIFTLVFFALFGLIMGSFFNVVISRLPQMLKSQWYEECSRFLNLSNNENVSKPVINLISPRSFCPQCKKTIKIWQNIPIISYLLLKGRCHFCHQPISLRYPFIEIITLIFTVWAIIHFGISLYGAVAILFAWILIILSTIDWETQLLPDIMTIGFLWLGLLINSVYIFTSPQQAIFGATIGYLFLWIIAWVFKLIRKKQGMGHGDFKLLAMIGAWIGVTHLLLVVFIAAISGLIGGLLLQLIAKQDRQQPIPFGPFLALGGWLVLLYGDSIYNFIFTQLEIS